MREALQRAKYDLEFLSGCLQTDPSAPDETYEVDVTNTLAWISRALDGREPLTIDPRQTPPD